MHVCRRKNLSNWKETKHTYVLLLSVDEARHRLTLKQKFVAHAYYLLGAYGVTVISVHCFTIYSYILIGCNNFLHLSLWKNSLCLSSFNTSLKKVSALLTHPWESIYHIQMCSYLLWQPQYTMWVYVWGGMCMCARDVGEMKMWAKIHNMLSLDYKVHIPKSIETKQWDVTKQMWCNYPKGYSSYLFLIIVGSTNSQCLINFFIDKQMNISA